MEQPTPDHDPAASDTTYVREHDVKLRRILTRFLLERAPTAYIVDAAYALGVYLVLSFFSPLILSADVSNAESTTGRSLSEMLAIRAFFNPVWSVTYLVMLGFFAWGCVRLIADANAKPRDERNRDSLSH